MWSFYANCCGFEKMAGNDVLLVVPAGTDHWVLGQNQSVGLLQNVSDGDFEVEVKFDSLVTQGAQEEGILVQQDAQNFIFFGVYNDGTGTGLLQIETTGGTSQDVYDQPVSPSGSSFWIRLNRTGSTWTQSWSSDGSAFTPVTALNQALTVSAIGPAAGNRHVGTTPAPSFTAAVDYFFNTASPITPGDGGMAPPPNQPVFNIWYGNTQNFGLNGIPQEQVDILGNVSAPTGIQSASFTVNGGASQVLHVGPNSTRLTDTGDFDVEMCIPGASASCGAPVSLQPGPNTIVISATDNLSNTQTHTVTVNWNNNGLPWPIPYSIDWSTVTNVQDVVQVVDGQWSIQPDGTIRTQQVGSNREIALGDVTWTDYQVVAEMTINHLDCTSFGTGLAVGWSGHTFNSSAPQQPDQPTSSSPLYALGWYASYDNATPPDAELAIYANSPNFPDQVLATDNGVFKPTIGTKYIIKLSAQQNAQKTASHYTFEIWPSGTSETNAAVVQADGDPNLGSVLFTANGADVSFGKIQVCAIGTTCTLP